MKNLVREIPLSNGLTVRFYDATRRYFGDYHQVRVKISFEVPLSADLFDDASSYESALKFLGAAVHYLKEIEHQGVPTLETSNAVEKVIRQFVDHSLSYFESEAFPKRFVQSELNRVLGKAKAYVPLRSNG
ncbi:MAG: hypothetical protein A2075_01430 [Geobacteraceae bacterium GWC2_58_44]|nr:MAG: hypothetical protein A2075_01430 [Geobacteraceae bacterium GWC2_58_44]HBG05235.1 hypothetical protein [Geobacter sp.]